MQSLTQFSQLLPAREQIDVFVSTQSALEISTSIKKSIEKASIAEFQNHNEVSNFSEDTVRKIKKGKVLKGLRAVLDNIVSVSWAPPGMDSGEFEFSLLGGISAGGLRLPEYLLIRRNELEPKHLTSLFSLFEKLPPESRPKIILDSEFDLSNTYELLSYNVDRVRVFSSGLNGLQEVELQNQPISPGDFLSFYEASALGSCASVTLTHNDIENVGEEQARRMILEEYLQVQANKRLGNKFETVSQITKLLDLLDKTEAINRDWKHQAIFFLLIDLAYAQEDPRSVELLTSIAYQLENPKLVAHANRMVNLSAGISPFSVQRLKEGNDIFKSLGEPIGQLYCQNNLLVTKSHLMSQQVSRFDCESTLNFAFENTSYSDRLSTVCSSVGVAHMLNSDLQLAHDAFLKGAISPGLRLHQLTARVNQLICEYVSDGQVRSKKIEECVNSILAAKLSPKLDYHQTYLLGNLLQLSSTKKNTKNIADILITERYLKYSNKQVKSGGVLKFVEQKLDMFAPDGSFSGPKGDFFRKYGVLPINHFVWN